MKNIPLTILSALCILISSVFAEKAEIKTYKGEGFTFDYSSDLQLVEAGAAIKAVRVHNGKGNQVMFQNYRKHITADKLSDLMMKQLTGQFKDCEELTEKTITRKILGVERPGRVLMIYMNAETIIEVSVHTFTHEGNTYCVMAQFPNRDTRNAEAMFKTIIPTFKTLE